MPASKREEGIQADASSSAPQLPLVDRRSALAFMGVAMTSSWTLPQPAQAAFTPPPQGFRAIVDKLDGYTFVYPERWLAVTSSGNDCFLRNPLNIDENVFVDISSPSSSRFNSVTDLGTPEQTAERILEQYLNKEFMSTRIGIKREGSVLGASQREGPGGRVYYDVAIRITSYASRNPYVATQSEVMRDYGLEWDRILLTTLSVANKRLYELRLQTAKDTYDTSKANLDAIRNSFVVNEVEVEGLAQLTSHTLSRGCQPLQQAAAMTCGRLYLVSASSCAAIVI
eukprot:CAMPEP_0202867810 /NCGR_PEP_ID=MMETSP1391-20130828/9638_1 /ASSEMBLY_ACC=CAM_ASM_000867 /TAXON_ID=1034604 /ORGANISM="Chlamydomonas leiostraca, Strain SAG 11-49" /LENGTH=283 /DNA_ID=CAMNT_0049547881 /DNA_START=171 /DNA_END=1024 /DNA_ORIENTATION=+